MSLVYGYGSDIKLNRAVDVTGAAAASAIGGLESLMGGKGRITDLRLIDSGKKAPDPNSRLGAYHATKGYPEGTVGHAAHGAIGTIYATSGTVGEEKIGKVFNSQAAKALYNDPVDGPSSKKLATMEFDYWQKMKREKNSLGGHLGSLFNPESRDWLQREFFR